MKKDKSQVSFLVDLLVALDMVSNSKVGPVLKGDTTLGVFAHFGHVLLDVFEGRHRTC